MSSPKTTDELETFEPPDLDLPPVPERCQWEQPAYTVNLCAAGILLRGAVDRGASTPAELDAHVEACAGPKAAAAEERSLCPCGFSVAVRTDMPGIIKDEIARIYRDHRVFCPQVRDIAGTIHLTPPEYSQVRTAERAGDGGLAFLREVAAIIDVPGAELVGRRFEVRVVAVLPADRIAWKVPRPVPVAPLLGDVLLTVDPMKKEPNIFSAIQVPADLLKPPPPELAPKPALTEVLRSNYHVCTRCQAAADVSAADPSKSACCFAPLRVESARD